MSTLTALADKAKQLPEVGQRIQRLNEEIRRVKDSGAPKPKPGGVSHPPVRKPPAEQAVNQPPYVPPTHPAARVLTGPEKQQNLAQLIYQVTTPDALEGVHPNTIARINAELNKVSEAGEFPALVAALGPEAQQRLTLFEKMAADPVMFAHEQNIARQKAFEEALKLAGTTPAPARPRGDADAALAARRIDVDVLDEASPEELMQWFDSLPEDAQLNIAKNSGATSTGVIDKKGMLAMAQQSTEGLDHLRRSIQSALLESSDQGTTTLRTEIVAAAPPRMRPQETPQHQPLVVKPGEGVTKLDDERAAAIEAERAREHFAPSLQQYGPPIATRESVKKQTGIKNTKDMPLAHRGNTDRQSTPMETRSEGERVPSENALQRAEADLEAAYELQDPELIAEAKKKVNELEMGDAELNQESIQQSYDNHLMTAVGDRPRPQHGLNRSNAEIDPLEAAAGDLAAYAGSNNADPFMDNDMVAHGPVGKKSGFGGRVPYSRRMGAIDRLFTQKDRVVNPFDIAEFGHDPAGHGTLAERILATNFTKGDADADTQRLLQQIAQEVDQYGASPTAIAEHMLRGNTFYKPGTANWEMARQELIPLIADRFGGRTAKPGSVNPNRVAPVDVDEPTVTITPDKSPDSTVTVEPDVVEEQTVTITPDKPKGKGGRRRQSKEQSTVTITPDPQAADVPSNVENNLAASAIDLGPESTVTITPDPAKPVPAARKAFGRGGNAPLAPAPAPAPAAGGGRGAFGRGGNGGAPPKGPGGPVGAAPPSSNGSTNQWPVIAGKGGRPKQQWPSMTGKPKAAATTTLTQTTPPPLPTKTGWRRWLLGAGALVGGGMAANALNNATRPTYINVPGGMSGGTDGEGTVTPDVSSQVSVPAEHHSGRNAAMDEQAILDRLSRIRGGTLGRMPMLHTMQEYH